MTVRELIEALQKQEPTDEVRVYFKDVNYCEGEHISFEVFELQRMRTEFYEGKLCVMIRHDNEGENAK